jgi:hypothetical protein
MCPRGSLELAYPVQIDCDLEELMLHNVDLLSILADSGTKSIHSYTIPLVDLR